MNVLAKLDALRVMTPACASQRPALPPRAAASARATVSYRLTCVSRFRSFSASPLSADAEAVRPCSAASRSLRSASTVLSSAYTAARPCKAQATQHFRAGCALQRVKRHAAYCRMIRLL